MKSRTVGKAYALTIGIILVSLAFVNVATANESEQAQRQFLAGAGLVCTLGIPNACPDIASASNGDKIKLAGSGTFTPGDDDASGGGTFTHVSGGKVLATGTWTAEELLSFTPGGSTTLGGFLPAGSEGGVAVIKVHVQPAAGGAGFTAILTVSCALATPGVVEGINLNVIGVINFNNAVSGVTLFIQTPED